MQANVARHHLEFLKNNSMDTLRWIFSNAPQSSASQTPRQWLETEIKEKRLEFIPNKKLSDYGRAMSGSYGSVQSAEWAARDLRVALKTVHNIGAGSTAYADFKREVRCENVDSFRDRRDCRACLMCCLIFSRWKCS